MREVSTLLIRVTGNELGVALTERTSERASEERKGANYMQECTVKRIASIMGKENAAKKLKKKQYSRRRCNPKKRDVQKPFTQKL